MSIAVAGCASAPAPAPRPQTPAERPASAFPGRPVLEKKGLEAVMGKDIATLKRLFGEPRLDVIEVYGRKMQFSGKACVLDAFLYPDGKGGSEIVTHIDARRSDGAEVDRAACVEALSRR
ncbi:hypothetical protein FOM92_14505 [Sphingorhabdus contaminans]|uniref:Uncharacterized protein n=2 Tax=Sphingorhabdus contaminans TaxID=1343899 RepID=A0A553WDF1_9SPHN|nr:hypothetical protein FOM92_14505 [Sphingorhabdus contaminans]